MIFLSAVGLPAVCKELFKNPNVEPTRGTREWPQKLNDSEIQFGTF